MKAGPLYSLFFVLSVLCDAVDELLNGYEQN